MVVNHYHTGLEAKGRPPEAVKAGILAPSILSPPILYSGYHWPNPAKIQLTREPGKCSLMGGGIGVGGWSTCDTEYQKGDNGSEGKQANDRPSSRLFQIPPS